MILIFDLDDTLYSEESYAVSGYKAVSKYIFLTYGVPENESLDILLKALENGQRTDAFQILLASKELPRDALSRCIASYRKHVPEIHLNIEAKRVLAKYSGIHKYLVTDGNKIVQSNKVRALKLDQIMERCFITHAYGLNASKPSTYCFQKIKEIEGVDWADLVYVGDDPRKDFVNLKPLGVTTIRVLTGRHAQLNVPEKFDAEYRISSIEGLVKVLELKYA
jgi:putative hydrolase of the HAD superfamily